LARTLHKLDFLRREGVEFKNELIDLLVGGGDGVLERGLLRVRRGGAFYPEGVM
jgi:hypothetical protein